MKKTVFILALLLTTTLGAFAQGAKAIKINEVMTANTASIQDEFGRHGAWIEICNASFSTFNVRGMFITTNKAVLDKNLSAPEREKLMSQIPNGEPRTAIEGRQHLVFFCNSNPAEGSMHLTTPIEQGKRVWIAIYDGNAVDLIDSVSVPALALNQSYSRVKDGNEKWEVRDSAAVTPGIANTPSHNDKIARVKAEDPHGFAISILAMGTVFSCLALLFIFFFFLGKLMDHMNTAKKIANTKPLKPVTKTIEKAEEVRHKTSTLMKDGMKTKGIDKEIYIAVIAMALKQYQDDVHDVESGIISIKPTNGKWNNLSNFSTINR